MEIMHRGRQQEDAKQINEATNNRKNPLPNYQYAPTIPTNEWKTLKYPQPYRGQSFHARSTTDRGMREEIPDVCHETQLGTEASGRFDASL